MFPDLINPLDGLIGRALHGPMCLFTFASGQGFTGADVEKLMRQYGIRIWGRQLDLDDELGFLVKRSQAVWAEYLLCRAGVPLTCKLLDNRNEAWASGYDRRNMPEPWQQRGIGPTSLVDHAVDWLDRIMG